MVLSIAAALRFFPDARSLEASRITHSSRILKPRIPLPVLAGMKYQIGLTQVDKQLGKTEYGQPGSSSA